MLSTFSSSRQATVSKGKVGFAGCALLQAERAWPCMAQLLRQHQPKGQPVESWQDPHAGSL